MTNGIAFKIETNITQGARLRGRNGVNREEADPNESGCKQNSSLESCWLQEITNEPEIQEETDESEPRT